MTLAAPFPWFGGKRRVGPLVWSRFGDVPNYVEPFAGSLAVLLSRPEPFTGSETVNDLDCYVSNFWRALQTDSDGLVEWAEWPVNEADILARHEWLIAQDVFRQRMRTEPDYYDAKIAGWWVWGLCSWIGSGWCAERRDGHPPEQLPHLGNAGMGIHRSKLPHLGNAGRGDALRAWMGELAARLSRVRVACGEWDRVLGDSVTIKHGTTAVLLDPPYDSDEHSVTYAAASNVSAAVRLWALEHGDDNRLRIALCGYDSEHDMPGWTPVAWKAQGGYGSQSDDGRGRENSERETIWFSPACLSDEQGSLFSQAELQASTR